MSESKCPISSDVYGFVEGLASPPLYRPVHSGERADLYEDGDHSDAMRVLSCLGVVGVEILVIMDQLHLEERQADTGRYEPHRGEWRGFVCRFSFRDGHQFVAL